MHDLPIHLPVTVPSLAATLDIKPYRLMEELMERAMFPGPGDALDDLVATELAASRGVNLRIIGDR